ncbi:MAG: hydrogenase expression/formation protein [Chloroflexi bacterium]|nr:hydrogenase expression/formation protein [Chloroflexota bacterium]
MQRLQVGKLPMHLLERLLAKVQPSDPRVLLGPRVGADAALLDFGERVLVAKADPITFATDLIGWYAVQVNANDLACMGASPRWFLATVLLPEGASEGLAEGIFDQLLDACRGLGVTLIGGHTEITYGLERPILAGAMLGEVDKGKVVGSGGARPGDALLLTKGIAIEGTALLAREAAAHLRGRGIGDDVLARARDLLFSPGISVVRDAAAACAAGRVHAMHDPTEGGLATGLLELARASGAGLDVAADRIPVLPECQAICDRLELEPLGLLGSGALLMAVEAEDAPRVLAALGREGIIAVQIGVVTPAEGGLRLRRAEGEGPLPTFPRDELARFLEGIEGKT